LDHRSRWSEKIIRPECTDQKALAASSPITRSRWAKSKSFVTNMVFLSGNFAEFSRGVTGETLLQLLETRLDNVIYRLGLANTRNAARQLVSHGHVQVNGRNVNVASFNLKAGDEIAIKDKPKSRQLALRNLDLTQIVPVPDWLTVDRDALKGKVAHIPSREEMQPIVNEQLIVELYSR
jgi:small subunit ribosomal protein S4